MAGRNRRESRLRLSLLLVALLALLGAQPALAHTPRDRAGPVQGVPIPEITHGQMAVIARHYGTITALAARQPAPEAEFTRILNHARIQRTWCLWGLVPGSVLDESSPFNECSHAYLAAARDLLLRMKSDPHNGAAHALAQRVEADMIAASSGLELCAFSAAPYDTATLIRVAWADAIRHGTSAGSLAAIAVMLSALTMLFLRWSLGK